ncbi:hypothetical protein GGI42DRAFT_353777 [Trichoderma sp. SZMC 28013]
MADLVFSSPDIEVVDVGCDLVNSEIMNLFLNATVITETFEADFDEAFDKHISEGGGQVGEEREYDLAEGSRLAMADLFSRGQVLEMIWIIAHAKFHAWQVDYLFEEAIFGSIQDGR